MQQNPLRRFIATYIRERAQTYLVISSYFHKGVNLNFNVQTADRPFNIILKEQLISHNEKARLKTLAQWRVKLQHGDTATRAETDKSPSRKKKR